MRQTAATMRGGASAGRGRALVLIAGLIAAACGCRQPSGRVDHAAEPESRGALVGGLSFSLPEGFVRKVYEKTKEPLLNIPHAFTEQVFASWEGPGEQSFNVFYWLGSPPRDLGPMVAAHQWKTRIAGQETDAAETATFMGRPQQVLVTWLEPSGGRGRYLMYARNLSRETFDHILATMSFQAGPNKPR
jgi:hypothetical protein